MSDKLPLWASALRWLGWTVSQEFQIVQVDHQGCRRVWTTGLPSRKDAEQLVRDGQSIRRVVTVER